MTSKPRSTKAKSGAKSRTPIGDSPEDERQVVRNFLDFLADRRVLFNPHYLEIEDQVVQSIRDIRQEFTEYLKAAAEGSEADSAFRAIRAACRRFLDEPHLDFRHFGGHHLGDRPGFFTALGEFRAAVGIQIEALSRHYRINLEPELTTILPPKYE